MIDIGNLGSDIGSLETTDILAAALYALFTPLGTPQHLAQGGGHTLDIVGSDIKRIGTTSLLKTRTCTGHDRQTAADGLDDGNAEALIDRRIDERLSRVVEHIQHAITDTVEHMDALAQTSTHSFFLHLLGIWRRLADGHQMNMLGQERQGADEPTLRMKGPDTPY